MSDPTVKYEVSTEAWTCCQHLRRSDFCGDCGSKRPEKAWTSQAEELAKHFEKIKYVAEKTAQTASDRIVRIEALLEKLSNVKTWQQLETYRKEVESLSERFRDQNKNQNLEDELEEITNGMECRHSMIVGMREGT